MSWNPKHGKWLVVVYWNDAHGSATTVFTPAEHKPYPMETYGLLLQDDAEGISLGGETYFDNIENVQAFRTHTFIPRGMVIRCEVLLKPSKPRKPRKPRAQTGEDHYAAGPGTV